MHTLPSPQGLWLEELCDLCDFCNQPHPLLFVSTLPGIFLPPGLRMPIPFLWVVLPSSFSKTRSILTFSFHSNVTPQTFLHFHPILSAYLFIIWHITHFKSVAWHLYSLWVFLFVCLFTYYFFFFCELFDFGCSLTEGESHRVEPSFGFLLLKP